MSVAGAVGFFLTSEVFLLGLPVTLPLVALLASKSQEKLQTEVKLWCAKVCLQVCLA